MSLRDQLSQERDRTEKLRAQLAGLQQQSQRLQDEHRQAPHPGAMWIRHPCRWRRTGTQRAAGFAPGEPSRKSIARNRRSRSLSVHIKRIVGSLKLRKLPEDR